MELCSSVWLGVLPYSRVLLEWWHFLGREIFGWTCLETVIDAEEMEKNDQSLGNQSARCFWGMKVLLAAEPCRLSG